MLFHRQVGKVATTSSRISHFAVPSVAKAYLRLRRNMASSATPAVDTAVATSNNAPAPSLAAEDNSFVTPVTVTTCDESQYKQQLCVKLEKLRELFKEFDPPEVEVFESPPSHYRMRAEFTVEQREGRLHFVMFDNSPAPPPPPPQPDT
ncbi:hypothetical protein Agub_g14084, partial [Astrephomene gubernaculifera]